MNNKLNGEYIAKSNGTTLAQHTFDVMLCAQVICQYYCNDNPDLQNDILMAAAMHDCGKIASGMQEMLQHKKVERVFPHSIRSLMLINPQVCHYPAEVLAAVAFHHWRDYFPDLLMGMGSDWVNSEARLMLKPESDWPMLIDKLKHELQQVLTDFGLNSDMFSLNTTLIEYLQDNTFADSGLLMPPYTLSFLPDQIRAIKGDDKHIEAEQRRVFMAGTLMRADHFASYMEDTPGFTASDAEKGTLPDYSLVAANLQKDRGYTWQQQYFDTNPDKRGNNIIFVGPTGVGKTEFSFLWSAGKKAISILPLQVAVNKLHVRAERFFSAIDKKTEIGLLHGNAAIEVSNQNLNKEESMRVVSLARHLASQMIVATADQIAPAALRYPGYERIISTLKDNCLIIDEVQAYDPRAAAIVTALMEQAHFFGGNTLLMTATLPPFIRREIKNRVGTIKEVSLLDTSLAGLKNSRHHKIAFLVHSDYDAALTQIIDKYNAGQRVLVVLNTVKKAQAVYEQLKSKMDVPSQLILLHSRFAREDRSRLEDVITDKYLPNGEPGIGPCIVVATQVVEASLDIDADILYTDAAPADMLIQRMGRVWRHHARTEEDIAPQEPNVIIMVKKPVKNNDDERERSIIDVYDRDLTALSLLLLASQNDYEHNFNPEDCKQVVTEWETCFRTTDRKKSKLFEADQELINKISTFGCVTLSVAEKEKWVDRTYELLEYPLAGRYMGKYLANYRETLEVLDHGYCSNTRREAERLFRDITDVESIPKHRLDEFAGAIQEWILALDDYNQMSYGDFALQILSRFIVNCPYRRKGDDAFKLQPEQILPAELEFKPRERLTRWLDGIYVVNLDYDGEKGLLLDD